MGGPSAGKTCRILPQKNPSTILNPYALTPVYENLRNHQLMFGSTFKKKSLYQICDLINKSGSNAFQRYHSHSSSTSSTADHLIFDPCSGWIDIHATQLVETLSQSIPYPAGHQLGYMSLIQLYQTPFSHR